MYGNPSHRSSPRCSRSGTAHCLEVGDSEGEVEGEWVGGSKDGEDEDMIEGEYVGGLDVGEDEGEVDGKVVGTSELKVGTDEAKVEGESVK